MKQKSNTLKIMLTGMKFKYKKIGSIKTNKMIVRNTLSLEIKKIITTITPYSNLKS